ncbi:Signaling protein with a periplasmic binding domain and GGDEF domain [gamma proteobacterium IMCC2047]|nr:Signaling protein with a periplasmic binding domain and GGDEF domain [gamma proteobacterium IMCC2047]
MNSIFEGLIQNIPAIFYRCKCDQQWTMLFINPAIEKLTGYPATNFISNSARTYSSIIHPEDAQKVASAVEVATQSGEPWAVEYRVITHNGEERWVIEMGVGIFDDQGVLKYLEGFIQNITERKNIELALVASERQIRDMAFTDCVTGLANRNLFTDRLDQMILDSKRYHHEFALLFIDLDGFKKINDTYGHLVGDKLLAMTGERISASFRDSDIVARFGGDEFLVIVKNTGDVKAIAQVCGKLLKRLAEPHYIDDLEFTVTASIGIAHYPCHATSSSRLIQMADKAMYKAKRAGRNCFVICSEEQSETYQETNKVVDF